MFVLPHTRQLYVFWIILPILPSLTFHPLPHYGCDAPNMTITAYPPNPSNDNSATFTFTGTDNVTPASSLTFECKLDRGVWVVCASLKTYSGLANDLHTFLVRAKDVSGNVDAMTASYTWKIAANRPPVTKVGGSYFVNEGTEISLSTSKSTDPDNNIVRYEWDLDNDGQFDDATEKTPKFTAIDNGIYTVRVRVTYAGGLSSTGNATVTVRNLPPAITSLVMAGGKWHYYDSPVQALATFKDAGINDTFTAVWKWGDGTTSTDTMGTNTVTGSHTYTKPGDYLVTITITDKDGGVARKSISIFVPRSR